MTTTMMMTLIMMEMMMIRFSKSISTWSSAGHLLKPDHALGLPPHKQGDVQAEGGDQPDVEEDDHQKIPPANLEVESCSTKPSEPPPSTASESCCGPILLVHHGVGGGRRQQGGVHLHRLPHQGGLPASLQVVQHPPAQGEMLVLGTKHRLTGASVRLL